ncbi:hypothetical protein IWQ60_001740 [Tieghemiomyces parasiticus]|uniref:Ubiquitin carboxyl-terminal hydrolase n=1 Tax=Tieghemiomyces parasiticus TaxID=78921 RepID=A0A9W8ACJ0_9FUNG|nr:hypothetical protein IWQ60_001740 [Tieghemiomyces parasiticus]
MKWIGMAPSHKVTEADVWPGGPERFFGLENFGNTCYCNSILQALYHCPAFRDCVLNYPQHYLKTSPPPSASTPTPPPQSTSEPSTASTLGINGHGGTVGFTRSRPPFRRLSFRGTPPGPGHPAEPRLTRSTSHYAEGLASTAEPDSHALAPHMTANAIGVPDSMFTALKDLFYALSTQKKRTGVYSPNSFIQKLRKENELFRGTMHQDAHEFLNFMLNAIVEDVGKIQSQLSSRRGSSASSTQGDTKSANSQDSAAASTPGDGKTWLHTLFEGILTNETKCLTCETVTSREESFLDLSIDIEDNSSVTSCLRQFSASEVLCQKNKFFCDECGGLQEAEKRMKVQKLPPILALHLKRFKFQERLGRNVKLSFRVLFPLELRLPNTTDQADNPDRLYTLFAVCVHIGSSPYHGHYVSVVKSHDRWILFDDDTVEIMEEDDIHKYFGDHPRAGSGYLLFYQAADLDPAALDLPHYTYPSPTNSTISVSDSTEGGTSDSPPDVHRAKTDLPAATSERSAARPTTGRPHRSGHDSPASSKRSSSLFAHRTEDMVSDAIKTRSPSLAADLTPQPSLPLLDALPSAPFELPPDQPAKIPPFAAGTPFRTTPAAGLTPPLVSAKTYSHDLPSSTNAHPTPWSTQPTPFVTRSTSAHAPLPPLPRSPSRAFVKGDAGPTYLSTTGPGPTPTHEAGANTAATSPSTAPPVASATDHPSPSAPYGKSPGLNPMFCIRPPSRALGPSKCGARFGSE